MKINKLFSATSLVFFGLSLLISSQSSAATFDFYSTGVDDNGNLLADGQTDSHYSLYHNAVDSTYDTAYATTNNPVGWVSAGSGYQWINPTGNGTDDLPCRYEECATPILPNSLADYYYTTTFDLTGVDLNSVYIEFQFAVDNSVNLDINNIYLGYIGGYSTLQTIILNDPALFVAGINTIHFNVANTAHVANPTGLIVNVVEASVPAPLPLALIGVGLAGIGLTRKRVILSRSLDKKG